MSTLRKRVSIRKVKTKEHPPSWYVKKCDTKFSLLIRSIGYCQYCGRKENLQCAHIIGRANYTLRWNPLNAICLCVGCHIYKFHRGSPLDFVEWLESKFPERMVYLKEARKKVIKRKIMDYKLLLTALNERDTHYLTRLN